MALAVRAALAPGTRRELELLERASGNIELADGATVAVCGTIEASGPLLRSPIHDTPVIAYQYQMYHSEPSMRNRTKRFVDYSGYGMVPAAVKSQHMTVPLAGFPALEGIEKFEFGAGPSLDNAVRFLRSASFDPVPPGEMIEWVEVMDKKWDGRSTVTANFRRAEGYDPSGDLWWEQRVQAGMPVCAFGVWSKSQAGLVGTAESELRLYAGTAEQIAKNLGQSRGLLTSIALVLTVAVAAAMWLLLRSRP